MTSSAWQAPEEPPQSLRFFRYFQHEATALQEQMDRLADTALIAGERSDAVDHCLAGITRLSNEVKDASGYLPPYDQRTYAEAIKALREKLEEHRQTFAPRPKFSFKSARKSPSALSLSDAAELAAQERRSVPGYLSPGSRSENSSSLNTPRSANTPPNEKFSAPDERGDLETRAGMFAADPFKSSPLASLPAAPAAPEGDQKAERPVLATTTTTVSITNQSNVHIILPSSALHSHAPCTLQRLTSCCLDLSVPTTATAPFASLTIKSVSSSLLLCGSVLGPAHITGVKNSIIVVSCRQFRMHECENVDVYLHCTSRPIIEDCKGIRFTKIPKTYIDLLSASQENTHAPTSQTESNMWDQVDDFKWLKAEPSPNWSILPADDIIQDDVWREVVPGEPGWSLDDILKAVGLSR